MAFRRKRNPDMNLNDVDFSITYQICQIFDIDRGWEPLGKLTAVFSCTNPNQKNKH